MATIVIVASMFVLFFQTSITDKSIAVLPFKYLSDDPEKQYLADGVMDAILLHLSKIEDLRVMDRTSVEQYRETDKTSIIIGQELDVAYLLEGSFQKYGDQVRLIIQLIKPGNEGHIWAEEYDRNWNDIFSVESEVAQTIAGELQAVIKPDEIQLIEKKPTTSLTAYDFYQRGRGEHVKYWLDGNNREALERAEDLYHDALEYDPAFAQAYTGLAWVYLDKNYWETITTENFLDSVLILTDIAISFDDQLAEAYEVRGDYYRLINKKRQAINEYDKAIKFNPNDWWAYNGKGLLFYGDDLVKTIDNFNKVALLHRGSFLPAIYRFLGRSYATAGFKDTSIYYVKEALKLDDDSAAYYSYLAEIEDCNSNFKQAIEFGEKSYAFDSTDLWIVFLLGIDHMYLGQFAESLEYFKKYDRTLKTFDRPYRYEPHLVGYAYWINGFKEEAEDYYQTVLEIYHEMLELGRHPFQDFTTFHNIAAIHAFRGDNEKAYEYLRIFNQRQRMPLYMIKDINNNPMFDSIRYEPEFQQIVRDVEAKYQVEHERVKKWLE
jgi:TolB-like protein